MSETGLPAEAALGDGAALEARVDAKAGARAQALATLPEALQAAVSPAMQADWWDRIATAEAVRQSKAWQTASPAARALASWLLRTMDADNGNVVNVPPGMLEALRATLGYIARDAQWVDPAGMKPDTQPFSDEDLLKLTTDPAPREWLVDRLIPHGRLSSLYGVGEAGKSRLVLQLAAAVIAGSGPMIRRDPEASSDKGLETVGDVPEVKQQGRVLLVTWEDEPNEVSWRWKMAHAAGAIVCPDPRDDLRVLNMRAVGGPLWAPHPSGTRHTSTAGEWTTNGRRVLASLQDFTLCVVDPIAAAYACSEIDRALVRAFCSAIDGEAEQAECTVILVGHPPKTGEAYSGNTDWYSAPRAMLTLGPVATGYTLREDVGKVIMAPCLLRQKGSYGRGGNVVWLRDHWRQPTTAADRDDHTAQLAWFATTPERAAAAKAGVKPSDVILRGRPPKSKGTGKREPQGVIR